MRDGFEVKRIPFPSVPLGCTGCTLPFPSPMHPQFLRQFLASSVRTEDPSAANLFYIPDFTYGYTGARPLAAQVP